MAKSAFDAPRSNIFMLLPEELTIVTDPAHWLYDDRVETPPSEEFINDLEERGIIQPINVVKEDDRVLVAVGRRRTRAAMIINQRRKKRGEEPMRVPCWQRKGTEAELLAAAAAENFHRRNDTLAETVARAIRLMNLIGDEKLVGKAMNKTPTQVKQLVKVTELHKSVRTALFTNKLGLVSALEFHGMPLPEQATALEKLLKDAAPSPGAESPSPSPETNVASAKPTRRRPAVSGRAVKEKLGKKGGVRGQKEIEERLETKNLPPDYRTALLWVLRRDATDASSPTKAGTTGLALGGAR